jgi:hypothetical protein
MGTSNAPPAVNGFIERRRTPRIDIVGYLDGQIVSHDIPLTVLEIGLGGFGIETRGAFLPGTIHQVRFTLDDGTSMIVRAKVVHCHVQAAADGSPRFVTGFKFADERKYGDRSPVADLIDHITGVLSFETEGV